MQQVPEIIIEPPPMDITEGQQQQIVHEEVVEQVAQEQQIEDAVNESMRNRSVSRFLFYFF